MNELVTLEPWEYVHACTVGAGRFAANFDKQNAAHYLPEAMEDDRTAQVAGAVAELAVAKFTNRYWSGSVWQQGDHDLHKLKPDVGRNIEVKRVRTRDAAVRKKQVGLGLVLFVARPIEREFRQVEIWGWLPYDVAWELGDPAEYDRSGLTRTIARDRLNLGLP